MAAPEPQIPLNDPRTIQIVSGALLASTVLYVLVALGLMVAGVVPENGLAELDQESATLLGALLAAFGVACLLGSFPFRRLLASKVPASAPLVQHFRPILVGMAIAENPGVAGLVYAMLTGSLLIPCLLWALSIVGCTLHFPTRAWIESKIAAQGEGGDGIGQEQ